jgi:hypothetical protein
MDRTELQALRAAVYRGDGEALVAAPGDHVPTDALQLAGGAIAAAAAVGVLGARRLAEQCASALRDRGWTGDEELAAELSVALDNGTPPRAKGLAVDLDELADILEAPLGEDGGAIDLSTGEVWAAPAIEYAREVGDDVPDFDDEERWLWVHPEGSHAGYADMEDFIATVPDPARAMTLGRAIEGKRAFRRFKDAISDWPDEQERWYRFSDERRRGRARAWLSDAGHRATGTAHDAPE